MRDAKVLKGDFASVGSTIYPGTEAGHFGSPLPQGGRMEVHWQDDAGRAYSYEIKDQPQPQSDRGVTVVIRNGGRADVVER